LLAYDLAWHHLQYQTTMTNGVRTICLERLNDPLFSSHIPTLNEMRGVTFYVPDPWHTRLTLAGKPIPDVFVVRNPADAKGPSIGIRWYPANTKDYTVLPPVISARNVP
jgi:hypothetical protein